MSTKSEANQAITSMPVDFSKRSSHMASSFPIQVAVYISGHGYGHYTRTLNFLSLFSPEQYNFHIRTTCSLYENSLPYPLQATITQTSAYSLDNTNSLQSLENFSPTLAEKGETLFLQQNSISAIISDALPLACLLGHNFKIPSILVTNFTFDNIFQALLDSAPPELSKAPLQLKINEMTTQYGFAHTVIRLPGYIPFHFSGPKIVDVPMHFRAAKQSRIETLAELGLSHLRDKKILLNCFGGQVSGALDEAPNLPEGWVCISQSIDSPPFFYKIMNHVYMPDLIGACDVILGKLGWGTCSEIIGNGCKPFIYVPRSAFIEEDGLLPWMEKKHQRMVRLEVEKYESTDWVAAIEEAWEMREKKNGLDEDWKKNDEELVRIFEVTIKSALH